MSFVKRSLGLLTLSVSALLVNGANPRGAVHARAADLSSTTDAGETTQAKIAGAMSAGPAEVAKSARIIDTNARGTVVLREGNNGFTCMPGDPRAVGDPPMCTDEAAMQWSVDFKAHKAKPTNTGPGIIYMLVGATQRSDTDPYDTTSPPRHKARPLLAALPRLKNALMQKELEMKLITIVLFTATATFAQTAESRMPVTDAEKIADSLRAGPVFVTKDATRRMGCPT